MSTRSVIAIEDPNKQCRAIYCHFDGYVSNNGRLLLEHYNTPELAEALLALGSLSCLAERPAPDPGEKHSYDHPVSDICIAYHRDRGEEFSRPKVWHDANSLLSKASDSYWAEYVYLLRDGKWYVDSPYQPHGWRLVEDVLKEQNDESN